MEGYETLIRKSPSYISRRQYDIIHSFIPLAAFADFGPKPSIAIYVKNYKDDPFSWRIYSVNNQERNMEEMSLLSTFYRLKYAFSKEVKIDDVVFPDKNLAIAILEARKGSTGIGEIKKLVLSKIKNLNLEGLEHLTGLECLDIVQCDCINPTPLAKMPHLRELYLYLNGGMDYQLLSQLHSLKSLTIADQFIKDLSFLEGLTQLEYLDICSNNIGDISVLRNLKSLKVLDISENPITDFSPLEALHELEELQISDMNLTEIRFIENLKKLKSLDVSGNPITDYSPAQKLPHLTELIKDEE